MKKQLLILFYILNSPVLFCQSVAINTNGAAPNTSSILDITSTTKGLLIPRMTTAQRTAIATPAKGLMVFDITTNGLWFHNGTAWNALSSGSSTNYWSVNGNDIYNNNAGNVGIGTIAPFAYGHGGDNKITEISNPNTGSNIQSHLILSTNGTSGSLGGITWASQNVPGTEKRLGFIGDVYETGNAARLVFYTRNDAGDLGERLTVSGNGNVGIGTAIPDFKLTINQSTIQGNTNTAVLKLKGQNPVLAFADQNENSYGYIKMWSAATFPPYTNGLVIGASPGYPIFLSTNNYGVTMTIADNGNVGIGTTTPGAKLQVAGNAKIDGNNTLEFGAGVAGKEASAGKIGYQTFTPDALDIVGAGTGANRKIKFWNEGGASFGGNVGIGEASPVNKLQIGSMGPTGFNGNDIAIGNGTNAMGIFQSNPATFFASSTDIVLLPRNSGQGRVGINTSTPRAPLDVISNVGITGYIYNYLNGSTAVSIDRCNSCTANVSIMASGAVLAYEFDAYSDARIKNIAGVTNSSKDLQTINLLQITDYSMKDKAVYGNKIFKKVIAQEVEKIYPQVISKHTDFIPNVYQLTNKVEKTSTGYLLSFTNKHNISNTAKKLRVLLSGTEAMKETDIVSIPSDSQVIINVTGIKSDKVFVYGEEVDDFRTVDYEGLTTLNISATQELSKLITAQNKKIEALEEEIKMMKETRLTSLQTKQ